MIADAMYYGRSVILYCFQMTLIQFVSNAEGRIDAAVI